MPYLVDGISALCVVAEEVPGKDDPGDVGGAALLPFIPKLPCHHVHQQLGAQQALAPASTQAQTRHQQHKPAREFRVLLGAGKARGSPKRAVWSYWWGSSPSQGSGGIEAVTVTPLDHCPDPGPLILTCLCRGGV